MVFILADVPKKSIEHIKHAKNQKINGDFLKNTRLFGKPAGKKVHGPLSPASEEFTDRHKRNGIIAKILGVDVRAGNAHIKKINKTHRKCRRKTIKSPGRPISGFFHQQIV